MNYAKYNFAYSLTSKGMIHMSINKKKISLLTALIIAFSSFSPAFAAKSVSDLKKAINDRDKSIKQTEKKINDKKAEKNQEVEKRNNLDIQISAVLDDISDTEAIISEKDQKISAKTAEINELSTQIEENNNKLKNRLKVIYEYGATSYLQLLLESNGLADLVTRLSVVKQVYNYDKSVIADYISAKQTVEDARQVIQNEQNEQLEAKGILESKKANLESLKSEKQKLIDSINSDIKSLEKEEQQKEDDYASLKKELDAALAAEAAAAAKAKSKSSGSSNDTSTQPKGTGKFSWPSASTNITSNYGYRNHPISGTRRLHRGIDIGAPLGSNVFAADSGTVVTAGWNNSYGYYVTINHGGGYVTLYAHNSKLLVSAGDKVTKGQVISKCGSTGNSTGPHVHFEVMLNGSLQNPLNYLN